jgi:hypothetical protein
MKKVVRIGIVGLGNIGRVHARHLLEGKVPRAKLTAVVDTDPAARTVLPGVPGYASLAALVRAQAVDAVIVATPHYHHTVAGIAALQAGLHVLMEKPLSVDKADGARLLAAHTNKRQVFGLDFNQRTDPAYQRLREMVRGGELGAVRRVNWTITDWFRPNSYYAGGGWRATWAGEGGGVLLNQAPHNLDLLVWIFGLPVRVRGFCQFGRYHPIEVEDDVPSPCGEVVVDVLDRLVGERPGCPSRGAWPRPRKSCRPSGLLDGLHGVAADVRTWTRPSSASLWAVLTNSRRRSRLRSGRGMRMSLPSTMGLMPRLACLDGLLDARMRPLSQGWTWIRRGRAW